ncbi:MAG TPA: GspH/FimT family pseudopilin [Thermoanaerobaculia bacterium]|nr:GspH/FimT family pseudopilin [Thermoanaerobaculia bacterium]
MRDARGFQLVELVLGLALGAAVALLVVPPLLSATARLRVGLAAAEMVGVLRSARSYAVTHNCHVAVKFFSDDRPRPTWALFRDGDGDGVSSADIASGEDPQVTPRRALVHLGRHVGLGIPESLAPKDPSAPSRLLARREDPIRFNRSDLASFGPLGTATPGSLYLSDGRHELVVVRVMGRTGRVRVLRWNDAAGVWE